MKNIFKPEDFKTYYTEYPESCELMAGIANEKLNKLIESMPAVYGNFVDSRNWTKHKTSMDTHQARLAFIEGITPETIEYHYVETGITVDNEPMYKRVKK